MYKKQNNQKEIDVMLQMHQDISDKVKTIDKHPLDGLPQSAIIKAEQIRESKEAGPADTIRLMATAANLGVKNTEDQHRFSIYSMGYEVK